ncbi:mediator of DNA damage checkpoint protein 1 isoform X7 [Equus przewalskii]|uniref:Mediator of DNA damage checkpoint protein 1 n=2 Tax=Equus przewalskii TaxID=9798 RepID=A0ABM4LME3_EQUPR
MMMEDTQAINWEVEEEEETERPSESLGCSLAPVGRLRIFSSAHGPEKDFPLYLGKNVVGRMPDCSVALPFPSISKQHAVIEILAWGKAPILQDSGSLNGTQILRPPKVLSPGVSHRLRDQELILFADLLCQYHRLDAPLPFVSRGPLTVEETPKVQGGTHPRGLLLAEDSEEEVDPLSERHVVKEPRTSSSSLATVVPESDEEGPSPAPGGPGPPFAFNLDSDTDEEESQQPATGEAFSAAMTDATVETEPPKAITTEIQLEKDQCSVEERDTATKVKRDARNEVVPVGVILERTQPAEEDSDTDVDDESRPPGRPAEVHLESAQPSGFIDSDTDVEEEGIPTTPAVVPMKKRQVFHGDDAKSPGAPGLANLQESPAGSDTDVEEGEALLTVPLERSQASMVIDSNTDDEEEVSAALTLARLKESRTLTWHRDTDVEEDKAQPVVLLEQSQTSARRDSDTDVEEEGPPVEKRGTVPKDCTDKAHSEKSQPPLGDSDIEMEEDKSSPAVHLERSEASATVDVNTQVKEEVLPGPAVTPLEKHQVPVAWTNQTDVEADRGPAKQPMVCLEEAQPPPVGDCEITSLNASAVTDVRKSQFPTGGDAGTEWAVAVLEQERAPEAGAQGGSPVALVEQGLLPVSRENLTDLVVDTGTPGEPTQPRREGAQTPKEGKREPRMDGTKDSADARDDSEDLDLQATQCFVEKEGQSLEVQSTEDEPTQAFLLSPPQEPGPSRCSFQAEEKNAILSQTYGATSLASFLKRLPRELLYEGALDELWEVLATQPYCPRESEASETQPVAAHLEAHGSCPSPPRATPGEQHPESPVHAEPLGIQGRGMHTVEKDMGTPGETADRVNPERGPLERATKKPPPEGERKDVMGEEELTWGLRDSQQKQVLARDTQRQESDKKVTSASPESGMESLKVEIETAREIQEKEREKQTLAREIFEREAEKLVPGRVCEVGGLEVKVSKVIQERGPEAGEPERGTQDQEGQASSPTPEPRVGAGGLQALASAVVASGSQSGGGRGVPVSPRRQERDHLNCKMPPAEKASRGDQESPEACLPPAVTEASAPLQNPLMSQSQKHPTPQPLPSLELPIPRARQNGSQGAPEIPPSELEPLHPKPKVRPRGSSRMLPSPMSSIAPESHPTTPTDQPVSPEPTSRATRSRTYRSSEMTPAPVVPTAPELQSSTSKDQPVTAKLTSRATRGRTHRSSVKSPEPVVPTAPELQPSTSKDQPVTPEPTSRGRTHRSSVKAPEQVVPTAPELQPSTSKDQSVIPTPTSRATRGRTHRSSVKTPEPVVPTAPEFQPPTPTDQPVTLELISRATRGRTHRASVKTPEPVVPTAPELQPPTSKDQSGILTPTSRATRGRTHRFSVKSPEPIVPIAPELQPSTPTDQSVASEPTSGTTQGRTHRSSVKTPELVVPTGPEFQPSTSINQLVTPKPTSQPRTHRSSVKTPEPIVPTTSELQPSTPTDQPVTPKPTSRATRGRKHRSVNTSEPIVPTAPELQPSTPTDKPVTRKPTSRATRGRTHRSSVKTPEPIVPTAPELQPSTPTDKPVTCKPTSRATRGRKHRSSVKTPKPIVPTASQLQPSTPTDQSVTPESTTQDIRGRKHRSSVKTPQPMEPTAPGHEPPSHTDQPVTPEAIAPASQSRTLRTSIISAVPVPTTPEFRSPVPTDQPIPPETIPQANCSRRPRATRKQGSPTAPIVHEPCSAPPEPNSRNQRRRAVRAAESLTTIPEPAFAQLPEAPTHAPHIEKVEAAGTSGFTPEPQRKASQSHKRPLATLDLPPLQKRLQRGKVSQKTAFLQEEEDDPTERPGKKEVVVMPGPGKRKRDQAEEEGILSRSLRRTKPNQESTAPKVLFTGVVDVRGERAVLALGGSLASSVAEASHLVTDRIRRTVKFLCALGRGIPILSLDWLHQSRKAGCFLPPDEYVVTDPEQEENFGFSLRDALSRARERRLLEGYEIHVTPGVQPPPLQMGEIISCCGGTVLPSMPRSYKPQRVVITCSQDFPRCAIPSRVGLPILSPEFLLTGVLKQEAKPEAFVLSALEMSST